MIRNNIIIFSVVLSAVLAASSAFAGKETTSDALKNSEKRAEKEYKNIHKESEVHKGSKHRYRSTHNIAGQTQQKWKIYSQDGLCVLKLEPFKRAMKEHQPEVWFTNLRKNQTAFRNSIDVVSLSADGIIKVSPFYNYSDEELDAYLEAHNIPNESRYYDPTKVLENRECGLHA